MHVYVNVCVYVLSGVSYCEHTQLTSVWIKKWKPSPSVAPPRRKPGTAPEASPTPLSLLTRFSQSWPLF